MCVYVCMYVRIYIYIYICVMCVLLEVGGWRLQAAGLKLETWMETESGTMGNRTPCKKACWEARARFVP